MHSTQSNHKKLMLIAFIHSAALEKLISNMNKWSWHDATLNTHQEAQQLKGFVCFLGKHNIECPIHGRECSNCCFQVQFNHTALLQLHRIARGVQDGATLVCNGWQQMVGCRILQSIRKLPDSNCSLPVMAT